MYLEHLKNNELQVVKGSEDMRRQSDGFSLVEVIIAIAVLAIVAMSLLSYFSSANFYSSSGKNTQKADMAGQWLLEELNSYRSVSQLENSMAVTGGAVLSGSVISGGTWSLESESADKAVLSRAVSVDDTNYQARVTLDYNYETPAPTGSLTAPQYNNYNEPDLEEIYSSYNVVLEETDQSSTAESYFFYKDTSVAKTTIRNSMTREMEIEIEKDAENPELYRVKAYYVYKYNGASYKVLVKEKKIEVENLQNVYLFYNLLRGDIEEEPVKVTLASNISKVEAKKISLYFVSQKGSVTPPANYRLDLSGNGNWMDLSYYTNKATVSAAVHHESDIVKHSTGKRIAMITVEIYREGETDYTETNRIVRLQSTKGA